MKTRIAGIFAALICFSASAERSISFVINPETQSSVLKWNDFTGYGGFSYFQLPVTTLFSDAPALRFLTGLQQEMSFTSFIHQCLYKLPDNAGNTIDTFFVMSPNVYDANDEKLYPITESADRSVMRFSLAGEEWPIKRIELEAVHYGMLNTYDKGEYSSGIIRVNGVEKELSKSNQLQVLKFDFDGNSRLMSQIELVAPQSASVAIRAIRIYPDYKAEFVGDHKDGKFDYAADGCYRLPYAQLTPLDAPELMDVAVMDASGTLVDLQTKYEGDYQFDISPVEDGQPMEEGRYAIVYYYDDGVYKPAFEDGVEFNICPTLDGLRINDSEISIANSYCAIPTYFKHEAPNGDINEYTWDNAMIHGHKDGTLIYWKVSNDGASEAKHTVGNVSEGRINRAVSDEIPVGYQLLTEKGINLNGGNHLSLILERNGARSNPHDILYSAVNVETGIETVSDGDKGEMQYQYYNICGHRVPENELNGYHGLLIEKAIDKSGRTVAKKLIK